MNNRINYKNLNELIKIGKTLLRIILVVSVIVCLILGIDILEKTKIFSILGTIIKIISPLFLGLLVAWLFEPLIKKLEHKKLKRGISAAIVYLSFIIVIVVLLVLVVPEFIDQLEELIYQLPDFISKAENWLMNILSKLDSSIDKDSIMQNFNLKIESITSLFSTDLLSNVITFITNFISSGFNVLLGLLIGFYLSLDFNKINKFINKLIPKKVKKDVNNLLSELNEMARGYVSGTLLTSLLVSFLTFLGLVIAGVNSPLLFAIFCGITNIIPYFGPYIGGIPTIIVGFSISPLCGIICLITIVLVQAVEGNIINPLVIGKAVDLHPIVVLLSLLIFEYYFGIVGMILATPIIGSIKILFIYFEKKYNFTDKIKPKSIELKKS